MPLLKDIKWSLFHCLSVVVVVLLCSAGAAVSGDVGLVDGLWVMRHAEDRYKGNDRREQLTITVYREPDTANRRVMQVLWFEKDYGKSDKIVVHFMAPASVAGTNLLMNVLPYRDDDRWLYFPQEKIYRRIRAKDKNSNFMGTDFTYDDLAEHEPDEENHKLLRIEAYGGTTCYVVESTPKTLDDAGYRKKVTWVDNETFVKLKIEYWDLGGVHQKVYTAEKVIAVDKAFFPTVLTMRTDRNRQVTIVERKDIKLNVGLKDELFVPQSLESFPFEKY